MLKFKALFGLKERKWKKRKLLKSMDEHGLRVSSNSSRGVQKSN
jgi:hypothetical protein